MASNYQLRLVSSFLLTRPASAQWRMVERKRLWLWSARLPHAAVCLEIRTLWRKIGIVFLLACPLLLDRFRSFVLACFLPFCFFLSLCFLSSFLLSFFYLFLSSFFFLFFLISLILSLFFLSPFFHFPFSLPLLLLFSLFFSRF